MRPDPRRLRPAIVAALLLLGGVALAADLSPQEIIETRLMCYCGCANLNVHTCTCGTADAMRAEIADRLARGESPDQIVAVFVSRHGEQILSSPVAAGFNLMAWITPFAAILIGGALLVLIVRRWEARGATAGRDPDAP
ncbi:MAG TPA: cytochrome c-type biogenesis protein CcmH, partial [Candidatus Polarisedimenticolia bacterium]|nr:cytochrome c-type biogenesis protein CcmH [Candidatus Polarisedimenticolia bacterium]